MPLITKLSHMTIYVQSYDTAIEFYTKKLGFELRSNFDLGGGMRWVTVGPKHQPDLELVLYEPRAFGVIDEDSARHLRALLEKSALGGGVLETDDCRKDYEELKAKGVEFISAPKQQDYGLEAVFRDGCGNWFSLTQRPSKK
jgi:catechol 2,3-dioxygenase-like lactoylglutathione lyase family enzyme